MRRRGASSKAIGGALGVMLGFVVASAAQAGAWPMAKGQGQVIVKVEDEQADAGYGPSRDRVAIPHLRDDYLTAFAEYGLTDRLTLQAKASYTSGEDQFVHYSGRGPFELGLRLTAFQHDRTVISFYAGGVAPGVGRNAEYAAADQGKGDAELRALFGQSAKIAGREAFVDAEVARLFRSGSLADETRFDITAGIYATPKWLVLVQSYSGVTDDPVVKSEWVKLEGGLVRRFGPWAVQAGLRGVVYGKETPISYGPVFGIWRSF